MPDDNISDPLTDMADAFYAPPAPENPTPVDDSAEIDAQASESASDEPIVTPEADAEGEDKTPETDASAAEDKPTDDVEEVELATFEQLADHLETDASFLEGLTISQKVNGEAVEVKLADALQTHRQVVAGDTYLADAKEKSKAMLAEAKSREESIGESAAVAATMIQALEKEFESDIASIDWAQLRADDPAAAALKLQDVEKRRSEISGIKETASNKYKEHVKQVREAQEAAQLARMPEELENLVKAIPEWADEEKASAERKEVVQYMHESGFTEDQIKAASFSSMFLSVMIKAKRYDSAKGKSDAIRKKVIKIPKTIKPGKKQDESSKPKADATDRASQLYG